MSFGVDSFGVVSYGAPAAVGAPGAGSVPGATGTSTGSGTGGDASAGATSNASVAAATGTGAGSGAGGAASSSNRPTVDRAFAIIGQSNASGRGTNNQTAPAGGAYLYDNSGAFVALADPWDAGPNTYSVLDDGIPAGASSGYGSCVPGLAQSYATAGKSTLWVPANKGTTNINSWQRNLATTSLYGAMKARIDAAGGVDTIIIHLGESDAMSGTAQATFTTKMNQLVTDLIADFGCQVYLHKIHNFSGYAAGTAAIRAAIDDCWTGSSGVKPGADLDGITTNVHFVTNTDISTVVSRTFAALENVAATGGSGSSSGSGTGGAAAGAADTGPGTGTGTGSGTGGDATGQAGTPAVAGGGTGTSTGSGAGGDATGQAGTPAVVGSGTGTSTGSGTGGDALGQVAGAGNVAPATGTSTGSGTGGTPAAQASASDPGGAGTGSGSGTGGNATGGALVNAVDPGGTGTGVGSGFGGAAGQPSLTSNPKYIIKAVARRFVIQGRPS